MLLGIAGMIGSGKTTLATNIAVARAIANGRGVPYPDPPERDAHGLPAAIWTLPSSEAPA